MLWAGALYGQLPNQRTRGVSPYQAKLPRVHIGDLSLSTASDYTSLPIMAADSVELAIQVYTWQSRRDTCLWQELHARPGTQQFLLCLIGIAPGPYTVAVWHHEKIISYQALLIER